MSAKPMPDYPTQVDLERALEIVAACAAGHGLPVETVGLAAALGRILDADIRAPRNVPPFATSAMDGFALRGDDLPTTTERAFVLVGEVQAGAASMPEVQRGHCARVATGAPMPLGADTVVIQEHVRVDGGQVWVSVGERPGGNVRAIGENHAEGALALSAGGQLGPPQIARLAALGMPEVAVRRMPRVAIIGVGSELVAAGRPLAFGQIHASNVPLLAAMAREAGFAVSSEALVGDDPAALNAALLQASTDADIVVTAGGMSAGKADCLPEVLAGMGEIGFHKIRCRPFIPMLFGQLGACLYFGLPGTPAGSAVGFRVFVQFAARVMLGAHQPAPGKAQLAAPLHRHTTRAELARCRVHVDAMGVQWASLHGKDPSGARTEPAGQDALAWLPEGTSELAAGAVVTLWP